MFLKHFCFVVGLSLSLSPISHAADCRGYAQLNKYERGQFIEVSIGNRTEVLAQFLARIGCGKQMLDSLGRLGATIKYADQKSGYALVSIPRDLLLDTLDLEGIQYAYTRDDDRLYYQDPAAKIPQEERRAEPVPPINIPYPRVATTLPKDGPYFEADEIGLTELWKEHPEADGRGVRVAVADEGFDLLHPALQQARDAEGTIVPKIADIGTLTSPDEDGGWVRFGGPIEAKQGRFEAAGGTWIVPEDGTYRFGIFKQELVLGPEGNSRTNKLSLSVGVLLDSKNARVWIDTDGDGSFKNERALRDFGTTHDIDWFGTKQGDDDNRIPFGVKLDSKRNAAYIRIGGEHGALVSGPLAANRLTGGLFDGAAPSAQLVDENLGRATLLASLVKMAARPDVDVINRSGGIGRAGYTGLRDGIEDFAQRVLERLIAVYQKPIVAYSAAAGTIHVNDYAGPEMLERNRQLALPYRDSMNSFVWSLPNGLVNTVLAPSANLETDSRYTPEDLTWPDGKRHSFSDDHFNPPAPDGYVIGANNSPTIPVVSGILADLISEAKRDHVRYNAVRLNNAIFTGARLLDGFPVSQQGYGLINAAQSWSQLSKMAKADDPTSPELTSFSISRVEAGHAVKVQGFHTELSKAGESVNGEITITRHGGFAGGRKYTLSLRGDGASLTLIDHAVILVRDQPARVRFTATCAPGWNIAFVELRDEAADVVMEDVPLSMRAPAVPKQIALGVDDYQSTIPPLHSESRYVTVGEKAQAVRYMMQIPYTGPCCSTRDFPGAHYREALAPTGKPVDATHHVGPVETLQSLVANNEPGTQEVFWENRGRPEYATEYDGPAPDVPIHAELTVAKYAVSIQTSANGTLTMTNTLADIDGRIELYDAMVRSARLAGIGLHASGEMERTLPTDLIEWRVRVTPHSSSPLPADLFLLNCSNQGGCYLAAQQEVAVPAKTLAIDAPQAGVWKIVVRARGRHSHPLAYAVRESLIVGANSPLEEQYDEHRSGETWRLRLPGSIGERHYAAFRLAPTAGDQRGRDGLLIAMTPLYKNEP